MFVLTHDTDTLPAVEKSLKREIHQVHPPSSPPAKRLCSSFPSYDVLDSQIPGTPLGPLLGNPLVAERQELPTYPGDHSTPDDAAIPESNPAKSCTSTNDFDDSVDVYISDNGEDYNEIIGRNKLLHGDGCREAGQDHGQDNGRPGSPVYLAPPSIQEFNGREDGVPVPIEFGGVCTEQDGDQEVEDDKRGDNNVEEAVVRSTIRQGHFSPPRKRPRRKKQPKTMRQMIDDSESDSDFESSLPPRSPQPLPYQPFANEATKSSVGRGDVQQRPVHISFHPNSANGFDLSAVISDLPAMPSISCSQSLMLLESILGGAQKLDDLSIKQAPSGAWLVTGLFCDIRSQATISNTQS